MGWLVPLVWFGALVLAGQVPAAAVAEHGLGLDRVSFVFLAAAAVCAPVLFLLGAVLNREKVPTTIRPLGREREVRWGTHTLYLMPIGYWALMMPVFTLVFFVVLTLV